MLFLASAATAAVNLSPAETRRIGQKIWQNECNGTLAGLTSWNEGENFASLGIGHFIWYPEGPSGPFEESFPEFVSFVATAKARGGLPLFHGYWLLTAETPALGIRARNSWAQPNAPEMNELRQFSREQH